MPKDRLFGQDRSFAGLFGLPVTYSNIEFVSLVCDLSKRAAAEKLSDGTDRPNDLLAHCHGAAARFL